ncbi:hypothetical protein B0J14DRAFT_159378 [Halenospora varia]|nr:hypothetical protein B0J14DRAFT_159378 [Halenospora varia]
MDSKGALMPPEPDTRTTPYESPIIILSIGPEDENPVLFYVHKEKLIHLPFFEAAIREDTFIEGQQGKISFEEEDPMLFRRVVEFIYEGDCFPRQKLLPAASFGFEVPLKVKSTASDSKEEDYVPSLAVEMASGTYFAIAETHQLFTMVTKLLCVADRYIIEDLVEMTFQKLKHFPIGIKELAVLAQHVIRSIPETRGDIHKFLADQVYLHLPRLSNCPEFTSLLESEMSILGRGLVRLITDASLSAQGRYFNKVLDNDAKVVVCITNTTVDGCRDRYGSDDNYEIKFGAAMAGEVLLSDGTVDSRNILLAQHVLNGPRQAFPASSFKLLVGASFTARIS